MASPSYNYDGDAIFHFNQESTCTEVEWKKVLSGNGKKIQTASDTVRNVYTVWYRRSDKAMHIAT